MAERKKEKKRHTNAERWQEASTATTDTGTGKGQKASSRNQHSNIGQRRETPVNNGQIYATAPDCSSARFEPRAASCLPFFKPREIIASGPAPYVEVAPSET